MARSKPDAQESDLKKWEVLGYGLGGFSSTLPNQFKTQFGMSFMTDVAGVPGGVVGILSMLTTVWDAINDPIIGHIADRTNTKRWGRYRPHMLCGAFCMAAVLLMMFHVPNLTGTGRVIYYGAAMAVFSVFFTQFTVPWQALNSVMSTNIHQRNQLLVSRQLIGAVATSMVGLLTMPVVTRLSDERTGWFCAACLTALLLLSSALCAAASARRQDVYQPVRQKVDDLSFGKKLRCIGKNRAVIFASLLLGVVNFAITVNAGISMYYLRCVVGDRSLLTVISGIQVLVTLLLVPFLPRMLRRWGKLPLLHASMAVQALAAVILMILRERAVTGQVILISLFTTTGLTFSNVCCFSLLPDCTDYTELHFGSAQAGFVNAISTFVRKLCGSFSFLLIGGLLDFVGYSNELPVAQTWVDMIVNIKVAVPLISLAAVLLFSYFYPITATQAKEMAAELHRKRMGK